MKPIIAAKINVTKIDKSRLFAGKNGKYLDLVLIPSPDDKYDNDYMVVEGISKEERQAGKKGTILGNAKEFGQKGAGRQDDHPAQGRFSTSDNRDRSPPARAQQDDDDVPF